MAEEKDAEKRFFERQLVVFKIGPEEFGVDISDIREIIKVENTTKIPDTDFYIDGVINLRGKIVVIVDLAKKLDLKASQSSQNSRIIVTETGGNIIGFKVDSCNEVLRLTGDKIEEAPGIIKEKINAEFIQGVGILDNRLIIIIDLAKVMTDNDLSVISSVESTGQKKKLLIVEDSTMMRGTLKSYINLKYYTVLEAGDGESALQIVEREKPNAILLDINLPKMSGVDVLKEVKKKYPEISVIMETSVYEEATKNACLNFGAKAYLKKPISKKQVEEALAA